jgi:hypothetical protein
MTRIRGLEFAKLAWNWEPHSPGQRDWILCNARIKVAACGRRWGKSESTAIDIALYAAEHSGTTQIVVAPTHDQTTIILDEVRRRLHQVVGSDFWASAGMGQERCQPRCSGERRGSTEEGCVGDRHIG